MFKKVGFYGFIIGLFILTALIASFFACDNPTTQNTPNNSTSNINDNETPPNPPLPPSAPTCDFLYKFFQEESGSTELVPGKHYMFGYEIENTCETDCPAVLEIYLTQSADGIINSNDSLLISQDVTIPSKTGPKQGHLYGTLSIKLPGDLKITPKENNYYLLLRAKSVECGQDKKDQFASYNFLAIEENSCPQIRPFMSCWYEAKGDKHTATPGETLELYYEVTNLHRDRECDLVLTFYLTKIQNKGEGGVFLAQTHTYTAPEYMGDMQPCPIYGWISVQLPSKLEPGTYYIRMDYETSCWHEEKDFLATWEVTI